MQESYREGVANHSGPEPCEGDGNGALEALDRGICRLGIELRNRVIQDAHGVGPSEGNTAALVKGESVAILRSRRPKHAEKLHARETGDPIAGRGPKGEWAGGRTR
jgi:hypothetical protein